MIITLYVARMNEIVSVRIFPDEGDASPIVYAKIEHHQGKEVGWFTTHVEYGYSYGSRYCPINLPAGVSVFHQNHKLILEQAARIMFTKETAYSETHAIVDGKFDPTTRGDA